MRSISLSAAVISFLSLSLSVLAQIPAVSTQEVGEDVVTRDFLDQRIKSVDDSTELSDEIKSRVTETYRKVIDQLDRQKNYEKLISSFQKTVQDVATEEKSLRDFLTQPSPKPTIEIDPDATIPQLEQHVVQARDAAKQAEADEKKWESEPARRATRQQELAEFQANGKQQADIIAKELEGKSTETPEVVAAIRMLLKSRQRTIQFELEAYSRELASYEVTGEIVSLQVDKARRESKRCSSLLELWQRELDRRVQVEAMEQNEQAREDYANAGPEVLDIADRNKQLSLKRTQLGALIDTKQLDLTGIESKLDALRTNRSDAEGKLKIPGVDRIIGNLLLEYRKAIPNIHDHKSRIAARQELISSAQFEMLNIRQSRKNLQPEVAINELLARLQTEPETGQRIKEQAEKLYVSQDEVLRSLADDYDRYFKLLITTSSREQELINDAAAFRTYLNEHIFWIPTTHPLGREDFVGESSSIAALQWMVSPKNYNQLLDNLKLASVQYPIINGMLLIAILTLLALQHKIRDRIRDIGLAVERGYSEPISQTCRAFLLTLAISILWPTLFCLIGWRLIAIESRPEFVFACARGLLTTAIVFGTLECCRQLCRPHGLASAHFHWKQETLISVRRNLRWLLLFGTPVVFVVATLEAQTKQSRSDTLGRILLIVGLLLIAVFAWRVLRSVHLRKGGFLHRTRAIWFSVGVISPLALAVLAAIGYHFTALQLTWNLQLTVWLILAILVLHECALRWLYVTRGRLALEKKRLESEQSKDDTELGDVSVNATVPTINLAVVNQHTRKLLRSSVTVAIVLGMFFIWSDFVPALGAYNVGLWQTQANESLVNSDGTVSTLTREVDITIGHLVIALMLGVIAYVAATNVPGLLEITIFNKLQLEPSIRYAASTLIRYAITLVGLIVCCRVIGLGWSQVQWLAAGISVGLGFGLQEIVANFISGLILLFERPIRVGDLVTAGDTTGRVSQIKMRATTITDFDRKQLVVPNKEFITGRVLNWTLAGTVNRLEFNVGVAYGSPTEKVREILLQIAQSHEKVLQEPAPHAVFCGFGDSTLNFVMRCYLAKLEDRLDTMHEIHSRINEEMARFEIEISFPQRDLHIRSVQVPIQIAQEESDASSMTHLSDSHA